MNFIEAVKEMKEGKKVREGHYGKDAYKYIDKDTKIIVSQSGSTAILGLANVEATDWEIYEEKKTLSDRLITRSEAEVTSQIGMYAHEDKIKQALKEFINYIKDFMPTDYGENQDIDNKAKEIFGERLVS